MFVIVLPYLDGRDYRSEHAQGGT